MSDDETERSDSRRPADAEEEDADEKAPSPPTPVREVMPSASPGGPADAAEASAVPDTEVEFEARGARWLARVGGLTRSGTSPDRGAPLLLVTFQPVEEEDEEPRREAWAVASELDELSHDHLRELFERSRPFRTVDPTGRKDRRRRSR